LVLYVLKNNILDYDIKKCGNVGLTIDGP